MRPIERWRVLFLVLAALPLSACVRQSAAPSKVEPAHVEHIEGSEFGLVVLTERAAARLGLETTPVRPAQTGSEAATVSLPQEAPQMISVSDTGVGQGAGRTVIPYSAVLYGLHGETWTYTSPEPLTFVRRPIQILYVEGDLAVLSDGPAVGTEVVSVGAAELYGTEFEVGH